MHLVVKEDITFVSPDLISFIIYRLVKNQILTFQSHGEKQWNSFEQL